LGIFLLSSEILTAQLPEKVDSLMTDSSHLENIDTLYKHHWNQEINQWEAYQREIIIYNKKDKPVR